MIPGTMIGAETTVRTVSAPAAVARHRIGRGDAEERRRKRAADREESSTAQSSAGNSLRENLEHPTEGEALRRKGERIAGGKRGGDDDEERPDEEGHQEPQHDDGGSRDSFQAPPRRYPLEKKVCAEAHDDQNECDNARRNEVIGDCHALIEQRDKDEHFRAAEDRGRNIGGDRAGEHQRSAGDQSLPRERQDNFDEDLQPVCSENASRRDDVVRHVFQGADQRQHHQRQEELQEADEDGCLGEENADRLVGQADEHERLVDDAGSAENNDPGIGARDGRDHQRQDDEADHPALARGGQVNDGQGGGIADDRGRSRHERAQFEGPPDDKPVERVGEETLVGLEGPAPLDMKAARQEHDHRQDEDQRGECRRRQSKRQRLDPILEHGGTSYFIDCGRAMGSAPCAS